MIDVQHRSLVEIEQQVCDVAAKQLGFAREAISPESRIIEDLHCDSLDLAELFMEIEEVFNITLPDGEANAIYKSVFTRQPFCLSDLAELVYLQQGTGKPDRGRWRTGRVEPALAPSVPFSQLGGVWRENPLLRCLFERMTALQFRRLSDGMRRVLIPSASVEIGSAGSGSKADEQPLHVVTMDPYLIDAEPVSTTAYCRFLNSIQAIAPRVLKEWFVLDPQDDRNEHVLVRQEANKWRPVQGTERWPMILVSWYGANAYSLWANAKDWTDYRDERGDPVGSFLPTEAQWEYAARGPRSREFPWEDGISIHEHMRFGQHRQGRTYQANTLPMADVNAELGVSPFGLFHIAGNVWQWCRDWYDESFYRQDASRLPNPVNRKPAGAGAK